MHQNAARGPRVLGLLLLLLVLLVLVGSGCEGMPLTPDLIGYLSCLQHAHQQALHSAVCCWCLTAGGLLLLRQAPQLAPQAAVRFCGCCCHDGCSGISCYLIHAVPASCRQGNTNSFKFAFVSYVVVERIALQHGLNGTGSAVANTEDEQGNGSSAATAPNLRTCRETHTPNLYRGYSARAIRYESYFDMPTAYGKLIIDAQTRLQAPANNSICQVLGLALGLQGPMWQ
jgi:hypothetical protein